jgi:pyruvate/2-oxoglutarate dehydrogenase complex dihydrolipoamide dehydrogenase (E3) component
MSIVTEINTSKTLKSHQSADVVIIGGGSGGIGAARAAKRRGASVVMIERGKMGGDCTFTGCVPSKALLEAAFKGNNFKNSMDIVHQAIDTIAATENAEKISAEGIQLVEGEAKLIDGHTVKVNSKTFRAKRAVILATGAAPLVPAIKGLNDISFLTSDNIFDLQKAPESLAIIGGGPIGVEMAEAFSYFGTKVTIIEGSNRILPREEVEASNVIYTSLSKKGVNFKFGSTVNHIENIPGGLVRITLENDSTLEAEKILLAVGRKPSVEGIGLQEANVKLKENGAVFVNKYMRTNLPKVYAVGDVAHPLQFTHVAYRTGYIAAINALSPIPFLKFNASHIPWVTYTTPEVAHVGVNEAQVVRSQAKVAYLPLSEVDRAIVTRKTDGFIKLIATSRFGIGHIGGGKLIGATIVSERAGEIIHEVVLAIKTKMYPARIAVMTHAYPSWSMGVQQAVSQFFGNFGGREAYAAGSNHNIGKLNE